MPEEIDLNYENSITDEFIKLFEEKEKALQEKINEANDELERVNYQIEQFYVHEEAFEGKQNIRIDKIAADKLIDRKLKRYNIIVGLISQKYKILQKRIKNGHFKDSLELANAKIDLLKTFVEIKAKKEFIKKNEERKNIYNK